MAFVKCECGFLKKDIPDVHIGKSKACPKCGKNITVNSSLFLTETKNEETAPAPIPIEATSPEPVKPDWRKIINTDVLLAVLKWYINKDRLLNIRKIYNKKVFISVILLMVISIILAWQTPFVKKYFFKKAVVSYLQEILDDPDALKIIKWGEFKPMKAEHRKEYPTLYGDVYWEVGVVYSGKNSFGGRVSKLADFYLSSDGKVLRHRDRKD